MAKKYAGENALTYLITLVRAALKEKVNTADIVNDLTSDEPGRPLSAAQGKVLAGMVSAAGKGDMSRAEYDRDGDGLVDDAKKLDGHGADYFAPSGEAASYVASVKGQAGGLVPLGEDKKIDALYLPSYVDDVVEGYYRGGAFYQDETAEKQLEGERGKIYVDLSTDLSYRYSGSAYVAITSSDMVELDNTAVKSIWEAAAQ